MEKEILDPFRRYPRLLAVGGIVSLSLLLIFFGCATTEKKPPEKPTYEKIPFTEILASPEKYRGRIVRLGGVIINTENSEEETTIEVLEKSLNRRGRPKGGDATGGRFMVVFAKFLDKAVYRSDRPVTIVGEIIGMRTAPIGEALYNYPLISGKDIRLWEEKGYSDWQRMHIGIGIGGGSWGTGGGVGIGTSF